MPEPHTDSFYFAAKYADGSQLDEAVDSPNGQLETVATWADIDVERLVALAWLPLQEGLPTVALKVPTGGDMRPILFRRRAIEVNPNDGSELGRSTIHALGWQKTVQGRNVQALLFLMPDGSLVLSDRTDAV